MMLAVLRSAHASASPRTCISWDLFTTDTERIERLMQDDPLEGVPHRHSVRVTTLLDAEMALEERGVTPVWMRSAFRKGVGGDPRRTLWSLRDPASDSDPKHSHPLNLLRFYLPLLPQMQHGRVLLFDDDVCVQDDLHELYQRPEKLNGRRDPYLPRALLVVLAHGCSADKRDPQGWHGCGALAKLSITDEFSWLHELRNAPE
jgi:hypothetical protein